jgi:hypothetical protein
MQFRYLRDPLFLVVLVAYFINRFVIKKLIPGGFFHDSFNDLICIPFWVPIMLFGMRKLGMRNHDGPPAAHEIIIPLLVWSVVFELILPFTSWFAKLAVSDYHDIFWYILGALGAAVWWQYIPQCHRSKEDMVQDQ